MRDTLLHTPHQQNVFVGNPILVPVPMWHTRQLARGYNQAHELARHLGLRCALEVRNDILTRTRDTGSQVESASRDQRIAHMTGAFNSITPLPKRPLVIIDDVITTGATVAACRRALLDAGASEVRILGLAQG
jgi:ComF family protein